MATYLAPYSAAFFNATPSLPDALQKHLEAGGNERVHQDFETLFQEHGVEKILGLGLMHHHFALEDDEYLTDVRGTSTAWKSCTGTRPSVWGFDANEKRLTPLEFAMDDDNDSVAYPDWQSPQMRDFLEKLSGLILQLGVNDTYGLVRYPGDNFPGRVEMTVGRANVNLTPAQVCNVPYNKYREPPI
ncbi:hypothetical protein PG994_015191 [Apiospora phragmitis]|uniref:Uncharacterized protein n=1 Tax=Apiospora phragmitis TaxID=2905665 RepID=A0ABR1SVS1_9PEZI